MIIGRQDSTHLFFELRNAQKFCRRTHQIYALQNFWAFLFQEPYINSYL